MGKEGRAVGEIKPILAPYKSRGRDPRIERGRKMGVKEGAWECGRTSAIKEKKKVKEGTGVL